MQRTIRSVLAASLASAAFGLGATSCGGGTSAADAGDLVLLGFSQPNVAGVALNQALIFTFSAPIEETSITPDTLRVVGAAGPFFLEPIVDGNLVALLPRAPNFDDASDCGLSPGVTYFVSMPTFPAVDTIESTAGKPLLTAPTFNFTTVPQAALDATPRFAFVESRRPLNHGTPPPTGTSDDLGCIQNFNNTLYVNPFPALSSADPLPQQTNSLAGGRLLCLENEGPPHIVLSACVPTHDDRAVGTPSAGSQNVGRVDLPAIIIKVNEQVDPGTVGRPYDPITQLSGNVRLYRVALLDGTPIPPVQVKVNKPTVVQTTNDTRMVLVATGPALQGIYMVTILSSVLDLSQKPLYIQDSTHKPELGPNDLTGTVYAPINAALPASVPDGYRYFFQTLQIPNTASALSESWGANTSEWGDTASGDTEPGVFTFSDQLPLDLDPPLPPEVDPDTAMATNGAVWDFIPNEVDPDFSEPAFTLLYGATAVPGAQYYPPAYPFSLKCGQSTTANWNNGFRFLNLASLEANTDAEAGLGRLKAVKQPYLGDGSDGVLDTRVAPFSAGVDNASLSTTPGPGASSNNDGIYEFKSFYLDTGDTLTVSGTRPLLILCRGNFEVYGTIRLNGRNGGVGIDTDGTPPYSNPGSIQPWGDGALGGPGGSAGGRGAGPIISGSLSAGSGAFPSTLFGTTTTAGGGAGGTHDTNPLGGGGGGYGADGYPGVDAGGAPGTNEGGLSLDPLLQIALDEFSPDRGYSPHMGATGGLGGGGGGAEDDGPSSETANGNSENGDDGGGGGGGGGGALLVIAGGLVRVDGTIQANGGDGGSTYTTNQVSRTAGPDGTPQNDDDVVTGIKPAEVGNPQGAGAPGGGGSGGAIMLIGEGGVDINGTLQAEGGDGGVCGTNAAGGPGGEGRILLMDGTNPSSGVDVTGAVDISPTAKESSYRPTVKHESVGQSAWYDLFVQTVDFNPIVNGLPQGPFGTTNFTKLQTDFGLIYGTHYETSLEFQGAQSLILGTFGSAPDMVPVQANGLTQWSNFIDVCDGRQFFRYRVRFKLSPTYPAFASPNPAPLPAYQDLTIPFTK